MQKRPKLENSSPARKRTLLRASSALALLLVVSACGSGEDVSEPAGPAPVTNEAPANSEEEDEAEVEENVENSGAPAGSEAEDIASRAEMHLDLVPHSREGLIEQLINAGFAPDLVANVVDTLGLDWNEQVTKRAKELLERTDMERGELISDLSYEGFTDEEAIHGADAAGL